MKNKNKYTQLFEEYYQDHDFKTLIPMICYEVLDKKIDLGSVRIYEDDTPSGIKYTIELYDEYRNGGNVGLVLDNAFLILDFNVREMGEVEVIISSSLQPKESGDPVNINIRNIIIQNGKIIK